jgi:hypothetical protein
MKTTKILLSLAMAALVILSACKKEDPVEPDPQPEPDQEIIIHDFTKLIDEDVSDQMTEVDTINYTLKFKSGSEFAKELKVGDIVVQGVTEQAPYGMLRKVKAVKSAKDGEYEIETEQASLIEAIPKGNIHFRSGQIKMSDIRKMELAEGVTINTDKATDFEVFSFDYHNTFDSDAGTLTIDGHTEMEMEFFFDYDWEVEWEYFIIPTFKLSMLETGFEIDQSASINIEAIGGYENQEEISLAKFYFNPWTVFVGFVPVVFFPQVELILQTNGTLRAEFTTSASEQFDGKIGVRYDDGNWSEISESTVNTSYTPPNSDVDFDVRADIGPKISVKLYNAAGPYANCTAFSKVHGHVYTSTLNWDLWMTLGMQSQVGVEVDLLGLTADHHVTIPIFEDTLFKLTDEPLGNNIYFNYPIDGQDLLIGDLVNIKAKYTGELPDRVELRLTGNVIGTDYEAPFEFDWNTSGLTQGPRQLELYSYLNDEAISYDEVWINLQIPLWHSYELSNAGMTNEDIMNSIYVHSDAVQWVATNAALSGKVYEYNAGNWNEIYTTNTGLHDIQMGHQLSGYFINDFHKVYYTKNHFITFEEMRYGQWSQPTFQWNNVFDIDRNSTLDNELVAIGKDTGIPYNFHIYTASLEDNTPTNDFMIPYPDEYGAAPDLEMNGDYGIVYNIGNEDDPSHTYFMVSYDGAKTWTGGVLPNVYSASVLTDASVWNDTYMWIAGYEGTTPILLTTTDGGFSWEKSSLDFGGLYEISSICFVGPQEGYLGLADDTNAAESKLYRTTDGGATWFPVQEITLNEGVTDVDFHSIEIGNVITESTKVYTYGVQ